MGRSPEAQLRLVRPKLLEPRMGSLSVFYLRKDVI